MGLFDDFFKFLNGNPNAAPGPDSNGLLQNILGGQPGVTLQSQLGRAVNQNPMPAELDMAKLLASQQAPDPNIAGRQVDAQPPPPPGNNLATTPMDQSLMFQAPDPMGMGQQQAQQQKSPDPQITLAPPPPKPEPPPMPRPSRGAMESFIEQLPELALGAFSNIGRNPIPYKGAGQAVGLGIFRGLQGAAVPFARNLAEQRVQARKESDAMQAAQALQRNPADLVAQTQYALRAPVGEVNALETRRLNAEKQQAINEAIKLAGPELSGLHPALKAFYTAQAQNGHFEGIVDTITGLQVPQDTRMRIASGESLTREDLVAMGRLPSQMQEKLFEVNAKAAQRILDRYPKIGTTHPVFHDGPDGGTVQERMFNGLDQQGRPMYQNLGDRVPRFKPGMGVEDRIKELQFMATQSAIIARNKNSIDKERKKLEEAEYNIPDDIQTDPAKLLAFQVRTAKKKEELDRREEELDKQSDRIISQPEMSSRRNEPKAGETPAASHPGAPSAPPKAAPGEKPAAVGLPKPPAGKMLLRDNKTGATGFYPSGAVPTGFTRLDK